MMAARGVTRRKILDLAESLLQTQGYNGFSYHHISQALNIKNAAIHYHFPTKEQLGLAIIKRTRDRFGKWIHHPENRILPVRKQIDWFIKTYQYNLSKDRICLIGALATDYQTLPASMQVAVDKLSYEIQSWVSGLLESGQQNGQLSFNGNSQDKALSIICALTGSLQLVRVLGKEYYQRIVNQIIIDLNFTY